MRWRKRDKVESGFGGILEGVGSKQESSRGFDHISFLGSVEKEISLKNLCIDTGLSSPRRADVTSIKEHQ